MKGGEVGKVAGGPDGDPSPIGRRDLVPDRLSTPAAKRLFIGVEAHGPGRPLLGKRLKAVAGERVAERDVVMRDAGAHPQGDRMLVLGEPPDREQEVTP